MHAIAHVHYERGDHRRGIESLPPRIHPCDHLGDFRNHLLWHLALLHLAEGNYDRVARLFERVFGRIPIAIASDQVRDRFETLTARYEAWWAKCGPRISGALNDFQAALISAM